MAYFENINLEKGMYNVAGKSFSEVLEGLDSSKNYEGSELANLDAFERQLMRYGIRVGGATSGTVDSFFASANSATLFPEYVARAVAAGMENSDKISDIVATTTKVNSPDYRPIKTSGAGTLDVTAEGEDMPKTTIKSAENLIKLKKYGRILESSYEALRFQRLDLFTVTLRQIGAQIAAAQIKEAVRVLENGDGNVPAMSFTDSDDGLSYAEFVTLWGKLAPFNLNTVLAGTDTLQRIMQLPEFKDSQAGQSFHGTGKLVTPLGAKLIHVPSMAEGRIIGIDKNAALEMVQAGEIITEADKLIDRQLDRAAISVVSGFSRIFEGAAAGIEFI